MRYSVAKDALYCGPCILFGHGKAKSFSSSSPVNDWKNLSTIVKRHQVGDLHKTCTVQAEHFVDIRSGKSQSIVRQVSAMSKQIVERNRHVLTQIIDVLILLGRQNIAIRGHTEDKSNFNAILQSKNDPIVTDHLRNSPEIQNEILSLCSDEIINKIVSDCKKAGVFSVMADECSDCSTREQLSVCVRFVENIARKHCVREEFLGFVTCPSIKGAAIAESILLKLKECGLEENCIRGQCYDGASYMTGQFNGARALIRQRVPSAVYVHCRSHCLNLALVHSSKIQCVRTMMKTVQDVHLHSRYYKPS